MEAPLRRVVERVVLWWALLGGIGLLLIVAATAFNIGAFAADMVARRFDASVTAFPGYEDFVRLTVSAAVPMLFPYCQLRRGHVAVDLLVDRMPPAAQRAIEAISLIGMTLLVLFLLYWMAIGIAETRSDQAVSRVLGWPEWPFYLPGLISLALWALVAGLDAGRAVRGLGAR
jgi:TRAP-type C4-dicarboxylate transport system permease small subunit